MDIRPIRAEADYLAALREVSALTDLNYVADTPKCERLEVLGTLVQTYEAKHHSIESRDAPIGEFPLAARD